MKKTKSIAGGWIWYVDQVKELSEGKTIVYKELLKLYTSSITPEDAIKNKGVFK